MHEKLIYQSTFYSDIIFAIIIISFMCRAAGIITLTDPTCISSSACYCELAVHKHCCETGV